MIDHNRTEDSRGFNDKDLVYIRPVAAGELQALISREDLEKLGGQSELFAVHNSEGERLAIVQGRENAFQAARMYELRPRSLH